MTAEPSRSTGMRRALASAYTRLRGAPDVRGDPVCSSEPLSNAGLRLRLRLPRGRVRAGASGGPEHLTLNHES